MIKLVDVGRQYAAMQDEIEPAVLEVLRSGWYVNGNQTKAFEQEWAEYCGLAHAIGVSNGLDALRVALMALDPPGSDPDEVPAVLVPANTYTATPMAVASVGYDVVLCDVDPETWLMTEDSISASVSEDFDVLMPVHLTGLMCDMDALGNFDVPIIEDAAQAQGATRRGYGPAQGTQAACYSFFPGKNLGALGDAGAITTWDEEFAERCRMIRNQGQPKRYVHEVLGVTARIDELQAAALRVKLSHLDEMNTRRRECANVYRDELEGVGDIQLQVVPDGATHVWHMLQVITDRRDDLQAQLAEDGIETIIHYPTPIHLQEAFEYLGYEEGSFPVAERLAKTCLTLPCHGHLLDDELEHVIDCVKRFYRA